MSNRFEPGPTGNYGADGIPREGMEERYATALWRDNPTAFWLHPEGPLSDTAPGEYFVAEPPRPDLSVLQNYHALGLMNSSAATRAQMAQYNSQQQSALNRHMINQAAGLQSLIYGGIFNGIFRL